MTNGGIIEGHSDNSGCSDLSPATFTFGSGETRMQMRNQRWFGGIVAGVPPRSRYFMMKYLPLLIVGASVSYGQQFNGTIFDVNTGRIQAINGEIETPYQPYQPQIDAYKKIVADSQARIDRMNSEFQAMSHLRELREQTYLLRKIANE
jgi:hypothetical protein